MFDFTSAFEITAEDVMNVCSGLGKDIEFDEAERLLDELDRVKVTEAALHGDDMEQQTVYAHEEIERQLKELNLL